MLLLLFFITSSAAILPGLLGAAQNGIRPESTLADIVMDLQTKLAAQERRINSLEAKDRRKDRVIETIAARLSKFEQNCDCDPNVKPVERQDTGQGNDDRIHGEIKATDKQMSGPYRRQTIRETAHVAFMAYLDHVLDHLTLGHVVKANKVLLNDGQGFNVFTGIFTAPVSGVYMFTFHFDSQLRTTVLGLVVDNVNQVDAVTFVGSHEDMAGNTAVIRVAVGQSVWLVVNELHGEGEVHATDYYRYSTFSGVLLY